MRGAKILRNFDRRLKLSNQLDLPCRDSPIFSRANSDFLYRVQKILISLFRARPNLIDHQKYSKSLPIQAGRQCFTGRQQVIRIQPDIQVVRLLPVKSATNLILTLSTQPIYRIVYRLLVQVTTSGLLVGYKPG